MTVTARSVKVEAVLKLRLRCFQAGLCLLLVGSFPSAAETQHSFAFHEPGIFKIGRQRFDLLSPSGSAELRAHAVTLLERSTSDGALRLGKKERRGLRALVRLGELAERETSAEERSRLRHAMLEIAAAMAINHRPVVPPYVGLPDLPFRFIDSLSNPVGKGEKAAANLALAEGVADLSLLDPQQSTFWRRPEPISSADLFSGFGRGSIPDFQGPLWRYAGPKTAGGNPGCELVAGSRRIKVKFAETHCEPFISRIFHALGYHVEPTDYVPGLMIQYDREFFQQFNSLPEIKMKIGVFFVPIYTFHFERRYDPFSYIERVIFKDGSSCSGREFPSLLLHRADGKDRFKDSNFNVETETMVDHLVTREANVQIKDKRVQSVGRWDFGGLGHQDLRELRGAGVLAAWVGWWDARFDNTRLAISEAASGPELRHYFNDLGAGLGRAAGTYHHSSEQIDEFYSTFTRRSRRRGIEFPGFEPIEDNAAFREITLDDARWMARMIAQLTETQISSALRASGFDREEVQAYTRKLMSRRDQLSRDTRLNQFPALSVSRPKRTVQTVTR